MIEQEVNERTTFSADEEAKIAQALQAMNKSADEIIDCLDRIHYLIQDINSELRGPDAGVKLTHCPP
ncbi:MAG: hypothetical protein M3Y56_16105 [Armatimonadota bacterium]|nr:hypothetical protein [Armatimonadota bacterium]